jgi:GNAT superfamily N-acetyltransferase
MENLRVVSELHICPEEVTFVREPISRHNVAVTKGTRYSPLAIVPRDGRGARRDFRRRLGGWLELTLLWAAEPLRGKGYGARPLLAAEEEVRMQGRQGTLLSTFGFLARPFYERHGYEVFGGLPDHPAGHALLFMEKKLEASGTNAEPV